MEGSDGFDVFIILPVWLVGQVVRTMQGSNTCEPKYAKIEVVRLVFVCELVISD